MEIEVGEYIRTEFGNIGKYYRPASENADVYCMYIGKDGIKYSTRYDSIIKHSKNIIDLIEEDDIVILEYYVQKYRQRITRKFEVGIVYEKIHFDNRHCSFWYDLENKKWGNGKGFNPRIKSILTKELFNQNSFKV